jgi:hypothetical protein
LRAEGGADDADADDDEEEDAGTDASDADAFVGTLEDGTSFGLDCIECAPTDGGGDELKKKGRVGDVSCC